jgi:hypothetical protein
MTAQMEADDDALTLTFKRQLYEIGICSLCGRGAVHPWVLAGVELPPRPAPAEGMVFAEFCDRCMGVGSPRPS